MEQPTNHPHPLPSSSSSSLSSPLPPLPHQSSLQKGDRDAPSGTSFYTNVTQQDSYPTLSSILSTLTTSPSTTNTITTPVHQIIYDLLYGIEQITDLLRTTLVYVSGTHNEFGDVQLSVDLQADAILWQIAYESSVVHYAASEEESTLRNMRIDNSTNRHVVEEDKETSTSGSTGSTTPVNHNNQNPKNDKDGYIICWDPLDGSSIVDNNWTVGTIVGVWPAVTTTTTDRKSVV